MEIRLAALSDLQQICTLYEHFYALNAGQQPQYYQEAAENGQYPTYSIESNQDDILVAVEDNSIIGFLHVKENATPPYPVIKSHRFAEVVDLFVEGSYRRKGAGTLLMQAAGQWAKSRGLDYLELSVLKENENGRRFYEHFGFNPVLTMMRLAL
jgi:GNAT superfamily N-acetyltransferase